MFASRTASVYTVASDAAINRSRDRRLSEVQDPPRKVSPRPRSPPPPRRRSVSPPIRGIQDFRGRSRGPSDSGLPARPHDIYRARDPSRDRSIPAFRPCNLRLPLPRSPDRDIPPRRMLSGEPRLQSPPRGRSFSRENNYRPGSPPPRILERERYRENNYRPDSPPPRLASRELYRGSPGRDLNDYQRRSLRPVHDERMPDRGPPRPLYDSYRPPSPTTGEYPSKRLDPRNAKDDQPVQYGHPHDNTLRSRPAVTNAPPSMRTEASMSYSRSQPQAEAPREATDNQRSSRKP